jgi:hypothetical protein
LWAEKTWDEFFEKERRKINAFCLHLPVSSTHCPLELCWPL